MTPNLQMEQFSLAYVRAVAAGAGYQVIRPEADVDSVDGVLMSGFGRRPRIDFQAKATSQDLLRADGIHFPLPVKNYEDLREVIVPRVLIVLLMPGDDTDWLTQTGNELCLHHCAYWLSLKGMGGVSNTSSITVTIPTANIFNRAQLNTLMTRVSNGSL